jgi:tetratricopeptide (TPR) repeat protein
MRDKKLFFVLSGFLALSMVGCDYLGARDNLNKGVRAYGESDYQGATAFFEEATQLDPELIEAELYLGMAYLQQFVPGAVGDENQRNAEMAVQTFESVLQGDAENTTALAGLASIYQNTNRLGLARESYVRQVEIAPDDPVAHYSVGSVNWMIVFSELPRLTAAIAEEDEAEESEGEINPDARTFDEVASLIEEGQMHLDRALELRDTYEDAMSYKNLLYRQAAELIPVDTEDEGALAQREELLAMADDWFNRALETRQRNAELAAAGLAVD